ncbi:MAG: hypothetical protein AB7I32_01025 [Gammaproteobacteria bacterium]
MSVSIHPRIRRPDPRREIERELLVRAIGSGPRELRRCFWTLYVQTRREREQEVRK